MNRKPESQMIHVGACGVTRFAVRMLTVALLSLSATNGVVAGQAVTPQGKAGAVPAPTLPKATNSRVPANAGPAKSTATTTPQSQTMPNVSAINGTSLSHNGSAAGIVGGAAKTPAGITGTGLHAKRP